MPRKDKAKYTRGYHTDKEATALWKTMKAISRKLRAANPHASYEQFSLLHMNALDAFKKSKGVGRVMNSRILDCILTDPEYCDLHNLDKSHLQ
jgi:hypothetical protein